MTPEEIRNLLNAEWITRPFDEPTEKYHLRVANSIYNLLSKEISEKDEALGAIEKYARYAIGDESKLMKVIRDIEVYASNALNKTINQL